MTTTPERVQGPERQIARDMARLGILVSPLFLLVGLIFWGWSGLACSALALAIVILNFLAGAWLIDRAASISPNALMGVALSGFLGRLILISVIVVPIRNFGWFEVVPFAMALVGGHLGLLAWETQQISGTLAYPGLPPSNRSPVTTARRRT